jgi:prevent-host-death family protein
MKQLSATEAQSRFSDLVDNVERGESYTITRDGRPIALLRSITPVPTGMSVEEAIAGLRQFRVGRRLGDLSPRRLIDDGRELGTGS